MSWCWNNREFTAWGMRRPEFQCLHGWPAPSQTSATSCTKYKQWKGWSWKFPQIRCLCSVIPTEESHVRDLHLLSCPSLLALSSSFLSWGKCQYRAAATNIDSEILPLWLPSNVILGGYLTSRYIAFSCLSPACLHYWKKNWCIAV